MVVIPANIVEDLRNRYRESQSITKGLRELIFGHRELFAHKIEWLRLARDAFSLSLSQAKPLCGWSPDNDDYLDDAQVDGFVVPDIESMRSTWDK